MQNLLTYASLGLSNAIINFLIYNYSFNIQATPFLNEEQRVESGMLMLKTTVPAFIITSLVVSAVFYFIAKANKNKAK
jgi:hypothetical protein